MLLKMPLIGNFLHQSYQGKLIEIYNGILNQTEFQNEEKT